VGGKQSKVANSQGACCDIWASRSGSGERYPSLQGRGPQISDMSAMRWEDSQSAAASVDVEEPASEHAEVWPASRPRLPQSMTRLCQASFCTPVQGITHHHVNYPGASICTCSARQHTLSSEPLWSICATWKRPWKRPDATRQSLSSTCFFVCGLGPDPRRRAHHAVLGCR